MESNPAIGEVCHLYKSNAVQSLIQKVSVTTTGRKCRVTKSSGKLFLESCKSQREQI
jgi:hypothetical protein